VFTKSYFSAMVYFAIDEHTKESKVLIKYLAMQKFVHMFKEPNAETKKSIEEARTKNVTKASSVNDMFNQLNA